MKIDNKKKKAAQLRKIAKLYNVGSSYMFKLSERGRKLIKGYYLRRSTHTLKTVTLFERVNDDGESFDLKEYTVPHELIDSDAWRCAMNTVLPRDEAPKCVCDFEDEDEETLLYSDGSSETTRKKRRQPYRYRKNGQLSFGASRLSIQAIEQMKRDGTWEESKYASMSVQARLKKAKEKREGVMQDLAAKGKTPKERGTKRHKAYKLIKKTTKPKAAKKKAAKKTTKKGKQ